MHRFYVPEASDAAEVFLSADEARHVFRVLRMREGDEVSVFDGRGRLYPARILRADKSGVCVALGAGAEDITEPKTRVTVYQGVPKAGKMEMIIQKCTELGAHAIVPVMTSRCVARMDAAQDRQVRWQRVAVEAAKQCMRSFIPQVHVPVSLAEAKASFLAHELALLPWEQADGPGVKAVLRGSKAGHIGVLIGPEGGLKEAEVKPLVQGGAQVVTLGKRILRTETVGMALVSIIHYEMDEMR